MFTLFSGDSEKFVMATPSTSPPDQVKVVVTLSGDVISHADINLKLPRPGGMENIKIPFIFHTYYLQYFDFTKFYRWKRSLCQYFYSWLCSLATSTSSRLSEPFKFCFGIDSNVQSWIQIGDGINSLFNSDHDIFNSKSKFFG